MRPGLGQKKALKTLFLKPCGLASRYHYCCRGVVRPGQRGREAVNTT
jgi:hypothetical protein